MAAIHTVWLDVGVLAPLVGAALVSREGDLYRSRRVSLVTCAATLGATLLAWLTVQTPLAEWLALPNWSVVRLVASHDMLRLDQLSAPILPLIVLFNILTILTTVGAKLKRFSFSWNLISLSTTMATFSCTDRWALVALLIAGASIPFFELWTRRRPTSVYLFHLTLFIVLLIVGEALVENSVGKSGPSFLAMIPLVAAVLVRAGVFPVHCWYTDMFENSSFGTALLHATPMVGAYAAIRLVFPIAPEWSLRFLTIFSLFTAVYSSAMALVQTDARRFYCFLFLSHSSLVLVGLETLSAIGLTGALSLWFSVMLSLGGLGLTLRAIEARRGPLKVSGFQGLYDHSPVLAACFCLTGLASVGFPGTVGFIGTEILVDAAVETYPFIGVCVVLATALNGIAIVKAYFALFNGSVHRSTISLAMRDRERIAVFALAGLIVIGGVVPQLGVQTRHRAALEILENRRQSLGLPAETSPKSDAPSHGAESHSTAWYAPAWFARNAEREN